MLRLRDLTADPQVVSLLDWPYDFALNRAPARGSWVKLTSPANVRVLAGNGAGGVFFTHGGGPPGALPVVYATSEGQAGKIANSLQDTIALHLQMPHWRDVLKFSARGDLAEMRRAAPFLAAEGLNYMPELPKAKAQLLKVLDVPTLDDPVAYIHRCVHATDCTLIADDGRAFDSLFNAFTIDQHPTWKQGAAQP